MSQDTQGNEEIQEVESPEQVPTQEQVEETPESQPDSNQEVQENPEELPEEVKERTKRNFERMRKQRDDALKEAELLRNTYRQPDVSHLTSNQVQQIENNFVDDEGNVDVRGLQNALQQSNEQARRAMEEAKRSQEEVRRYEQNRQTQEAYAQFPELDPDNPEYDPMFYTAVRNHAIGEITEGKNISLVQAAKTVKTYYRPEEEEVKKKAVSEYKASQEKRNQGPIESGKGSSRTQADLDALRRGTIANDPLAIMERLKRVK